MSKLLVLGATVSLLMVGLVKAAPAPKVTICHATSSSTNPWVRIVVSANAINGHFNNNGTTKAGHEGDKLLQGDVDCPTTNTPQSPPSQTNPSSTTTNETIDFSNFQGK